MASRESDGPLHAAHAKVTHAFAIEQARLPHKSDAVEREGLPQEKVVDERSGLPHTDDGLELLSVLELSGDGTHMQLVAPVSPPRDASSITKLIGLSWKHSLRDLKREKIEQVCLILAQDDVSTSSIEAPSSDTELGKHERPKCAEAKPVREERFAAQSLDALEKARNPVLSLIREFADVFPDKILVVLPAD